MKKKRRRWWSVVALTVQFAFCPIHSRGGRDSFNIIIRRIVAMASATYLTPLLIGLLIKTSTLLLWLMMSRTYFVHQDVTKWRMTLIYSKGILIDINISKIIKVMLFLLDFLPLLLLFKFLLKNLCLYNKLFHTKEAFGSCCKVQSFFIFHTLLIIIITLYK